VVKSLARFLELESHPLTAWDSQREQSKQGKDVPVGWVDGQEGEIYFSTESIFKSTSAFSALAFS